MIKQLLIFILGLSLLIAATLNHGQTAVPSGQTHLEPYRHVSPPVKYATAQNEMSFSDLINKGHLNQPSAPKLTLANDREDITTVGFAVDVSQLLALGLFDPSLDQMNLAGEFTDWGLLPLEMAPDSSVLNYFTLLDVVYGEYQYKYVISYADGTQLWEEGINRILTANEPFILLPPTPINLTGAQLRTANNSQFVKLMYLK
jgi:hypothetical protein